MVDVILESVSEHQAHVLDLIEYGNNVTVRANPGSGKTHLILQIASAFPERNMLVLSFNTALVGETEMKIDMIREQRSGWTHAHTYHGLLGTLVNETVYDEMIFGKLLNSTNFNDVGKAWKYRDVELLVIDEAQDLKERFVLLILIVLAAIATKKSTLRVVLLFDDKQTLYSFYPINKADTRFAMLASAIYGPFLDPPNSEFANVVLPVSYRLAPQTTTFLNALLPTRNLVSGHTREEPHNYVTLFLADVYRDAAAIVLDVVRREAGMQNNYGDILVLVNSLRSKRSPARAVVDMLVASGIPVHVLRGTKNNNNEDFDQPAADIRKNKVNFLTDCGAKGLQFRTVIKINEAELLEQQYITNPRFVALSRHSKRLYIIQNARYTTQLQIDQLLSHPQITQRVLRVIVKRQVPMELPVKKHRLTQTQQEKQQDAPPCMVSCESLFSFLDVVHMESLMQHLDTEQLGAEQFDARLSDKDEQPMRFVDPSAVSQYLSENVIQQAQNHTYVDVTRVVNHALLLALEFFFTNKIPACVRDIAKRTQFSDNIQEQCMRDRLDVPMLAVTTLHDNDRDVFFGRIVQSMQQFAMLAVVSDAYGNYRDLLFQLTDFSFATTDAIKLRLVKLRMIIDVLVSEHEKLLQTSQTRLCWSTNVTGHFVDANNAAVDLMAHIPLCSEDRTLYVFTSTDAEISNDDRLHALAATMTATTQPTNVCPNIFVLNIVALTVEKIELLSPLEQSIALDYVAPPSSKSNSLVVRHNMCPFLSEAISYKFWNDNAGGDDSNDDTTLKRPRNDTQADDDEFVSNIHKRLKTILEEQPKEEEDVVSNNLNHDTYRDETKV